MEPYGWYLAIALGVLSTGFLVEHLYQRSEKRRIKMCEWMERPDPYFDATDQQSIRNKRLFVATMLISIAFMVVIEFRAKLPLIDDLPGTVILGATIITWAIWAVPYGILPLMMPDATAVSDVLAQTGLKHGPEADQLAKTLLVKAEINRRLEEATERAKMLWVRATRAIIANDGSISAQNREIADLHRCREAGYPLPSVLEKAARVKHEKRLTEIFDFLDEVD